MSMYKTFATESDFEINGISLDYGSFRVKIARAGGKNKRFAKVLEAKAKPFRRAIQTEMMDQEQGLELLRQVYAEAVILNWETLVDGEWKVGIEGPDGDLLAFSKENIVMTLKNLPDLFQDIKDAADKAALFRQVVADADLGN